MSAPDASYDQLARLGDHAVRMGEAYAARWDEAAEAGDRDLETQCFERFDRCFFSFRVAVGLRLRLRRELIRGEREVSEPLIERDRREPDPRDRDREADRDTEPASFPILLKTLDGLCADADTLPGPAPAELPALRDLLAELKPQAQPRATTASLRTRLAGSTTTVLTRPRPAKPGITLPPRRATGPPRR